VAATSACREKPAPTLRMQRASLPGFAKAAKVRLEGMESFLESDSRVHLLWGTQLEIEGRAVRRKRVTA